MRRISSRRSRRLDFLREALYSRQDASERVSMPQESLLSRYRALTKPTPIEGFPDLLIFRPVAFLLVQVLKRSPITPNQVSFSAIAVGLLSGLSFAVGTRASFAAGGLLYA